MDIIINGGLGGRMLAPPPIFGTVRERQDFGDLIGLHDADYLKYITTSRIFAMLQQNYDRDEISLIEKVEEQLNGLNNLFQCKEMIHLFSGSSSNTFRAGVAFDKKYKGNRDKSADPYYYEGKIDDMYGVVKYLKSSSNTLVYADLEADDIASALQDESTFIISHDKDLNQIPGKHYDWKTNKLYEISEEQAFRNLMYQMLIGDTTDNISGVPGIGTKTGGKIIAEIENVKDLPFEVMKIYMKKFDSLTIGVDKFVEAWNLVKLRMKCGDYFIEKYGDAFALLETIKNS